MTPFNKMEIFKAKIQKLNTLKFIGDFVDLLTIYHLSKCIFEDCGNCQFIHRITQIYILFYPNFERKEEDGSVLVEKLRNIFLSTLVIFIHSVSIWNLYTYCLNKNST